jgi:Transposase, Mutator family
MIELGIPKLRTGSYFPHWLLERRRRAEQALISVVATAYLLALAYSPPTRRIRAEAAPATAACLRFTHHTCRGRGPGAVRGGPWSR